jgi:uncharacterized protein
MVQRIPRPPRIRRGRLFLIAIAFFFIISISTLVGFYTDLLWYREIKFSSVFWTIFGSKVLLASIFGAAFFIFLLLNLFIVSRVMPVYRAGAGANHEDPLERYRATFFPYVRWIAVIGGAFLSLMFALGVTPLWERFVLARNAVPFGGKPDPIFGKDIGFYVFHLPVYQFVYGWIFSMLVVVTLIVAGAHYLTGGIRPQAPGDRVSSQVKAHISVLIGLMALLRALGYRLDQYQLLYSTRGNISGATYTDVHAQLPALKLLVVISVIGAVLFLINIRIRGWALPLAGLGLWILTSILAGGVFPFVVQRFQVEPNQLKRESPYIKRNIEATRAAYSIDSMQVREYPAASISRTDIESNPTTVDNIRLWDPDTLKTAYRSLAEIRTYYQFRDVDVDRYAIGGKLQQVMLSVRELAPENLETSSQSWQNLHVVYTHGYGVVVSPTNESTPEGKPGFLVQDIPPKSSAPELELTRPGIYFGEGMENTYSLVRTGQQELDFGRRETGGTGGGNQYTTYSGKGGVPAAGLVRRLAFAWRFKNMNLAISGLIKPETKVLYYRQIRQRLTKAAPFLQFDGDPYPTIVGGRVVWIADGYTVSQMYPYSERLDFGSRTQIRGDIAGRSSLHGDGNYIRNSVKATVDAYDGTVRLYVWDPSDPIIQAWQKAFPKILRSASEMPAEVRQHVRYPEDLFRLQSFQYRRYHMTDPRDFYTREDLWVIPGDPNKTALPVVAQAVTAQVDEVQPYYVLMRLPDSPRDDYALILPMNPKDRPNMVSYLVAKSDPDDYGKLIDFRFPRDRLIDGVGQVHARINADPAISEARTLLGREGSEVIFGNLLVMPIGDSILYSQPFFVQARTNPIPELKIVILATSDKVVTGATLEEALNNLVQGGAITTPISGVITTSVPVGELVKQALAHLQAAEEAARRGDWTAYGQEQQAAKDALQKANSTTSPSPSPSPTPAK